MASAADIVAYDIPSTYLASVNTELFAEYYQFKDSLDSVESGGSFTKLKVFFSLEDTPEIIEFLDNNFTTSVASWDTKFVRRYRDDAKDEDNDFGWYYFPTEEFLYSLSSEQAYLLLLHSFSISSSVNIPDCWGDMLLSIFLVVIVTYFSAGTGTGSAAAWAMATLSVISIAGRITLPVEMQIAMSIVALGTSFNTSSLLQIGIQITNIGLSIYNEIARLGFEKDLKQIEDEQKALDKLIEAESFEQTMRYNYSEVYDAEVRQGHEQHPHRKLRERYIDFTIYPEVGMDNRWVIIE